MGLPGAKRQDSVGHQFVDPLTHPAYITDLHTVMKSAGRPRKVIDLVFDRQYRFKIGCPNHPLRNQIPIARNAGVEFGIKVPPRIIGHQFFYKIDEIAHFAVVLLRF